MKALGLDHRGGPGHASRAETDARDLAIIQKIQLLMTPAGAPIQCPMGPSMSASLRSN